MHGAVKCPKTALQFDRLWRPSKFTALSVTACSHTSLVLDPHSTTQGPAIEIRAEIKFDPKEEGCP